ncbi:2-amino-4-hydroxy-6-hydroxymethyldihydropteridine pyrophosphokinase [Spirochaetota bacterium]|nr:2-amino-4-hydroxy-6-hydroxymethyldihydropteridine pyrophosphokinase [Spirochaetota bacterium]
MIAVVLALGANIDQPLTQLQKALSELKKELIGTTDPTFHTELTLNTESPPHTTNFPLHTTKPTLDTTKTPINKKINRDPKQKLSSQSQQNSCHFIPSSIYKTAPLDYAKQPDFYNMALYVEIADTLTLNSLFTLCQGIETKLERVKKIPKGPRSIDIDIILYNNRNRALVVGKKLVIVPHPRYPMRQFVLKPMLDIEEKLGSPFIHPILNLTTEDFYKNMPWSNVLKSQRITKIADIDSHTYAIDSAAYGIDSSTD